MVVSLKQVNKIALTFFCLNLNLRIISQALEQAIMKGLTDEVTYPYTKVAAVSALIHKIFNLLIMKYLNYSN